MASADNALFTVPSELQHVVETFNSNTARLCQELSENFVQEEENFNLEEYWKTFEAALKVVSHEATKLSMLFDNNLELPSADHCAAVSVQVESAMEMVIHIYYAFPPHEGTILRKELFRFVKIVASSVLNLSIVLKNPSIRRNHQAIGKVWENCKAFEKLSKSNKIAVLTLFDTEEETVEDAKDELHHALEHEADEDEEIRDAFFQNGIRIPCPNRWNQYERALVTPCLKLIEVLIVCLRRLRKLADLMHGSECNAEFDEIASIVRTCSAAADDLVCSVYPPMNHTIAKQNARCVKDKIIEILSFVQDSRHSTAIEETFAQLFQEATSTLWNQISEYVDDR